MQQARKDQKQDLRRTIHRLADDAVFSWLRTAEEIQALPAANACSVAGKRRRYVLFALGEMED